MVCGSAFTSTALVLGEQFLPPARPSLLAGFAVRAGAIVCLCIQFYRTQALQVKRATLFCTRGRSDSLWARYPYACEVRYF